MIVGLTGGIGSGKTTVASFFQELGVPIYIADDEAKRLMATSPIIKKSVMALLGEESYQDNELNREYVSSKVFTNKKLLEKLNNIVHPEVSNDFTLWKTKQSAPYVIKEAAILFENGGYKSCDFMVLVTAPLEERIRRVRSRDDVTEEQVMHRIRNQWSDSRKIALSDTYIENIVLSETRKHVLRIHKHLKIRIEQGW